MQQRLNRAGRYRKEANKYADLAKTTIEPGFLVELYRRTAVRYVLMAEELERWPDPPRGWEQEGLLASLNARADAFVN